MVKFIASFKEYLGNKVNFWGKINEQKIDLFFFSSFVTKLHALDYTKLFQLLSYNRSLPTEHNNFQVTYL